jgi:23S rRNA (cytidine1920-2'-O)/16S rRNA (cytidine1409-2'-O)-methyltransferase
MPRLDVLMVQRGLAPTRSRAADLIRRGFVRVAGAAAAKPGLDVADTATVTLDAAAPTHVSRGAEKLIGALDQFALDPAGRHALDIGASTGGFTEVLLARGALSVTAVDVGRDQLHPRLRLDPRVRSLEDRDARSLTAADLAAPVTAVAVDVSFISLEKALPAVLALAAPGAWLAALVKPQFEAGPTHIGKGGIVRDAAVRQACVERIAAWLAGQGWDVLGQVTAPIAGGDGNQEVLIAARKPLHSNAPAL